MSFHLSLGSRWPGLCAAVALIFPAVVRAGGDPAVPPTLYVVPYAHLDTQWRWEYPTTIREFLPRTMRDNFALLEKYPHYLFNFSGANRYRLMQEYYPADFERVREYVAAGRWFPAGSSMEENDVNNPSAESILRQVLYGKQYFRRVFGRTSAEYMLPDCFGFPASLPSILAHAGIRGFSTQKLSWHSGARVGGPDSPEQTPIGIPFNVGFWEGPDGTGVIAALNAMDYGSDITDDLSRSPAVGDQPGASRTDWPVRVQRNGQASGWFADYRYYGTGDTGGSPREASVRLMEALVTRGEAVLPGAPEAHRPAVRVGDGPLRIVQATAEQMFLDLPPGLLGRLPRYRGDLELTEHSAGSLTSQAYLKRWNRRNEVLADAAERAAVAAAWLGAGPYPQERLRAAWTLVMGGQFHDIIPGTSTPKAYEYAWNDQILALNQFASVLTQAIAGVAAGMDTRATGIAVVVNNPLNVEREDVVEAALAFHDGEPAAVRVLGPDGREVPAQWAGGKVLFLARVPAVGCAVFDVQPAAAPAPSTLKVAESSLENACYVVSLDANGDVAQIFDKTIQRELLAAPARLAIKADTPHDWPAWNIDWADAQKSPRSYVQGPTRVRIVENGPARVAVEISRVAEGSEFVQTVRLAAGDAGRRVEFLNRINWHTPASQLKAVFPLTAANPLATYNWDVGTIQRGNNDEKKYEVASHQWFDLTDRSGKFGVTVLSDSKNGSDKPDDRTLQLTLLRTPGIGDGIAFEFSDQSTQDWGHHEIAYGLAGHAGDWREGATDWQAYRLNAPLAAFVVPSHAGTLGRSFSLLGVNNQRIRLLAVKQAEESEEVVVRLVETAGQPQAGVRVHFAGPVVAAREINGAEEPVGPANVSQGELVADFGAYQPRTFALKLAAPRSKLAVPQSRPVALAYERCTASRDGRPADGSFDDAGRALPAEMLPARIPSAGIEFQLGPATGLNAIVAHGQAIALPPGRHSRVHLLASSANGDHSATFRIGDQSVELLIQDWGGYIGQWDNRIWKDVPITLPPEPAANDASSSASRARHVRSFVKENGPTMPECAGLAPGFIRRAPVAWFASHRHAADGSNEPYAYSYLYAYSFAVPEAAQTLILPDDPGIRILAITVGTDEPTATPAQPLDDTL